MNQIPALIRVFAYLSILTVGGGMAAFPEMEELTVKVHHWLEFHQLIHLFSVGQLAPGPNMMAAPGRQTPTIPATAPSQPFNRSPSRTAMLVAFRPGRL